MKQQLKQLILLVLCAAACLCLASCGTKSTVTQQSRSETAIPPDESNMPTATGMPAADNHPTLEAFIRIIQPQIDAMIEQAQTEGLKMEVKAEDNTLLYAYQYTTDLGIDNALLKQALDAELAKVSDIFQEVLVSLKETVPTAEAVIVQYLDWTGTVITAQEWRADTPSTLSVPESSLDNGFTLESYVSAIQPQIDEMIAQAQTEGMRMEVQAQDGSLVYIYQYTTDLGIDNTILKQTLDVELEKVSGTFETVLSSLKSIVPDAEAVVVQYLDWTGAVITSREWNGVSFAGPAILDGEMTLKSYVDAIQPVIEEMIAQAQTEGMRMEVQAQGNSLVYIYQYTTDLEVDNAVIKAALDAELDKISDTFDEVLTSLKTAVPSAEAVVVQYLDWTGAVITSRTWDAGQTAPHELYLPDYLPQKVQAAG